jgi:ABC-2 type transport system ATP-binding protein
MLHQPDVVFLDEPTVGMDIFAKDRLRILLQDRVARHGLTVFLTTHDIVEVQRLCGRLILLDAGHVLYEGAPGELASMLGVSRALRLSSDQPVQNASLPDAQLMRADENEAVFWISAGAREADVMARALVLFPGASVTVEDIDLESLVRTLYLRRRTKDPERVQGEGKSVQA